MCTKLRKHFHGKILSDGTVMQLQEFIKKLNNRHPTIKFDFKFFKTSIKFLDTTVYKNKEQNMLLTAVSCKPADRRYFLHYTPAHFISLIKSIPYSQALHLKKNLCRNFRAFKKSACIKWIIYKSRFQRKISRFRILTIIRYWERRITNTPKSKEKIKKNSFCYNI